MNERIRHTDEPPFDVAVVGAGPAGLAAACSAAAAGARVCVLERQAFAGGVLPQCVHDGFGLHLYGRTLTGPEYADVWEKHVAEQGVRIFFNATVLEVKRVEEEGDDAAGSEDSARRKPFRLRVVGPDFHGAAVVSAGAVVAATGCRERTRGQMLVPGTRPAGVMTAGTAQYLINVKNRMPGTIAVILGSGDIGLIMARRLTLEGAEVRLVLGQQATGLLRNQVRCIDDFGIPERFGWGVARIHGRGQLKGVTVAPMNADGTFDLSRREYIRCNLLLLACGLVPEREIVEDLAADPCNASENGLFICGNAHTPCDLVDEVTQKGLRAGAQAALFALGPAHAEAPVADPAFAVYAKRLAAKHVEEPKGRLADLQESMTEGRRPIACTVCPTGCIIEVARNGDVSGNTCSRGKDFALAEMSAPMRLFTGTVKVQGAAAGKKLVPVRTAAEIPQEALLRAARACKHMKAAAPVKAGQVLHRNIAGTGVDLIAAASVAAAADATDGVEPGQPDAVRQTPCKREQNRHGRQDA